MKKRILTALLASAMILSVAGCDSTTDAGNAGAGDTTTTTTAKADDGAAADTTTEAATPDDGAAAHLRRGGDLHCPAKPGTALPFFYRQDRVYPLHLL